MGTDAASPKTRSAAGRDLAGVMARGQRRDSPSAASPDPGATLLPSDHYATQLRETAGPAFLYGTLAGLFQQADTAAFKRFRDRLLADAGHPSDPIEVMMVEQIVLAHMNVGRLQFKAATADTVETAKVYGGMAVQLLGEFRRTCLAIQGYRYAARHSPQALPDAAGPSTALTATARGAVPDHPDSELASTEASDDDDRSIPFFAGEESEPGGRRAVERAEAKRSIA
jgi:hypothetical protein